MCKSKDLEGIPRLLVNLLLLCDINTNLLDNLEAQTCLICTFNTEILIHVIIVNTYIVTL